MQLDDLQEKVNGLIRIVDKGNGMGLGVIFSDRSPRELNEESTQRAQCHNPPLGFDGAKGKQKFVGRSIGPPHGPLIGHQVRGRDKGKDKMETGLNISLSMWWVFG